MLRHWEDRRDEEQAEVELECLPNLTRSMRRDEEQAKVELGSAPKLTRKDQNMPAADFRCPFEFIGPAQATLQGKRWTSKRLHFVWSPQRPNILTTPGSNNMGSTVKSRKDRTY